jgi:hypothetical protein
MIPINQTIFSGEEKRGNCLQACIASLFELKLEEVPHFLEYEDWDKALEDFIDTQGYFFEGRAPFKEINNLQFIDEKLGGYIILGGEGPRGFGHAVIYKDGKLIHDPHPSEAGLLKEDCFFIIKKKKEG